MKKFQNLMIFLFISLFSINLTNADNKINNILENAKKAIVTIDSRIALSAYKDIGNWTGTGFIADKQNGLIVTNAHVVGNASIGTYFITFYTGEQAEAKLLYYDLWQDYAILKVDSSDIPPLVQEIAFSKELPKLNQRVFVVGNSEAQGFSFHTGNLSDLYNIEGAMSQTSYVINLNITGGASGSPVLNERNEAIGVLYGGGGTYALALHGQYVVNALEAIKTEKVPTRNHIGVITQLYSLSKAEKHRNFPKQETDAYLKKFPDARNRAISVKTIIPGSPAERFIRPGDIIWEINEIPLGGNLSVLDIAMDKATKNTVNLTLYRNGKKIEQTVPLYNVNKNKVEGIVNFAGANFFEADDYFSNKSGIPLNTLAIANVQSGSSFSAIPTYYTQDYKNLYRIQIESIGKYDINNIVDLTKQMRDIIKEKFVTIRFKNYQPYWEAYNNVFNSSHDEMLADIVFDSIDNKPRILKYNAITHDWIAEDI